MADLVVSDSLRAGVTVMAKTIASDLAPYGITVNNIATGPIITDRLIEVHAARAKSMGIDVEDQLKRSAETIPVRRMGTPKEIGDLCAYLASAQAGYLTGQAIVVDGGVIGPYKRLEISVIIIDSPLTRYLFISRSCGCWWTANGAGTRSNR